MSGNALELWTKPLVLEPGNELRGERCALCAMLIGGRPIRIITTTVLALAACDGGHLITHAAPICAEHEPDGSGQMSKLILAAMRDCDGKCSG